jgi:RNA recognition motif-containing protein
MIKYDKFTGKPRGFGFVTYEDLESVDKVIKQKNALFIREKWIDCKIATPYGKKKKVETPKDKNAG